MTSWKTLIVAMAVGLGCGAAPQAKAQGLIWRLPPDGTWIRYEGTYQQIEARSNTGGTDLTILWIQHLTIKSVGQQEVELDGKNVPCRWLEFKVQTGKKSEAGINPGPVGASIYKVLVPENRVIGKLTDDETIPVSFLPFVKGFRKDGEKPVEEMTGSVLQIFPKIALFRHFTTLEKDGEPESLDLSVGAATAQKLKGKHEAENLQNHTVHEAELWRSDDVPFGLAQWSVKLTMERKGENDPRSAFKQVAQTLVDMKAQETGTDAKSEVETP
ncbi:MAG: hypothetical protein ACKV2Q_00385 [Planctomycetaceae bacterium]